MASFQTYDTGAQSAWQPLPSQYLPTPAATITFDPASPLLFASSSAGAIASYFCSPSTGLSGRYTSYKAHYGAVGEVTIDNTGILSVGGGGLMNGRPGKGGSIKMATRRGLALWSLEYLETLLTCLRLSTDDRMRYTEPKPRVRSPLSPTRHLDRLRLSRQDRAMIYTWSTSIAAQSSEG